MRGYSLIELMVAITIGVVVMAMGVVSVNNFYDKQRVDAVTNDLVSMVRSAKNYAVTSQGPSGYSNSVEYVGLVIDNTGLVKILPGNNTNGLDVGVSYSSKKIDLGNVNISRLDDGVLMFSVPQGKLVEFYDGTKKRAIPRKLNDSVNILVRSKVDLNKKNGVLIWASGMIDEKANLSGLVPGNALANENTLTTL